jgi:hypothetical protein
LANNACTQCGANTKTCTSATVSTTCFSGNFLDDSKCWACSINKCDKCDNVAGQCCDTSGTRYTTKYCHASTCNAAAAASNDVTAGAVTTPVSGMVWILLVQVLAFAGMWMH